MRALRNSEDKSEVLEDLAEKLEEECEDVTRRII